MSIQARLRKLEAQRKPDDATPYGYVLFTLRDDGVTFCFGDGPAQPVTPAQAAELLDTLDERTTLIVSNWREDRRYRLWRDVYFRTEINENGGGLFYRVPQTSIPAFHDWLETDCPDGLELVTFEDWLNGAPLDALASDWHG